MQPRNLIIAGVPGVSLRALMPPQAVFGTETSANSPDSTRATWMLRPTQRRFCDMVCNYMKPSPFLCTTIDILKWVNTQPIVMTRKLEGFDTGKWRQYG